MAVDRRFQVNPESVRTWKIEQGEFRMIVMLLERFSRESVDRWSVEYKQALD